MEEGQDQEAAGDQESFLLSIARDAHHSRRPVTLSPVFISGSPHIFRTAPFPRRFCPPEAGSPRRWKSNRSVAEILHAPSFLAPSCIGRTGHPAPPRYLRPGAPVQ